MAIEIRELVIRIVVKKHIGKESESNVFNSRESRKFKNEILNDCMDKVKEHLNDLKSR